MPNIRLDNRLLFGIGSKRCSWDDIERIELYEQIIMREIDEMVAAKDYAGAFRYIGFLYRNYPNTPDLDAMRKRLLLENGAYLFSQKQYEAALVVMESLYRGDSNYEASKVSTAISRLAGAGTARPA